MKQLVFLLLLVSTAAVAETDRGSPQTHEMYNNCKTALRVNYGEAASTSDAVLGGFCLGYMRGFADGIKGQESGGTVLKVRLDVTAEALAKSFVKYLDSHPRDMDNPKIHIVLGRAWAADGIIVVKPVKQ